MTSDQQTTVELILAVLRASNGPMTVKELADVVDKSEASVRKALSRDRDLFIEFPRNEDGAKPWGLVEHDDQIALPDNIMP